MQNLPLYIPALFVLTTIFSVGMFFKAANRNRTVLYIVLAWLSIQAMIASTGFYTNTKGIPPRFILAIVPAFIGVIILFVTSRGRLFLDALNVQDLTLLHVVRVPVEIVLYSLFLQKAIPQAMTFKGSNFDILSGITAPIVWYVSKRNPNKTLLLVWNFLCLGLLANIVITAILAAPFDFQKIGFDQPNVAIFYFPYIWLPAFIVPLVLLNHLVSIRQLVRSRVAFSV